MRFVKKSHITLFPKLPFRLNFRKPFRNLPDTFRDSAVSILSYFSLAFPLDSISKNKREMDEKVALLKETLLPWRLQSRSEPWLANCTF